MVMAEKEPGLEPGGTADAKVRVAWLYYVEGLTQEQIARCLNISRMKVLRMLAAAREEGVVQIRITARSRDQIALERRLMAAFGLSEAVVVPSPRDEAAIPAAIGHAAGSYLSDQVRDGMAIAVGWGATLHMALRGIAGRQATGVSVISLLGGMMHSRAINPSAVARRMADAFGADCYQLTAPVFVSNETVRDALWQEPGLRELAERARRADLALVSVGDVSEESTLIREGLLPRYELDALRAAGAVGDVLCRFLDAEGRILDHAVNRRVMAVGLHEVRRIAKVVIAAGGRRKVRAIRAALTATAARVLITDEEAALGLLQGLDEKERRATYDGTMVADRELP